MLSTFRKHQSWLMYGAVAVIIYSFVAYFNPAARYKQNGPTMTAKSVGSIFGEPVSPAQMEAARREAMLFVRINGGNWPSSEQDAQIRAIAYRFLLIEAELKNEKITVTPDAAARFTKRIIGLKPEDALSQENLNQVLGKIFAGAPSDVGAPDFMGYVQIGAGQQLLTALYGMSGQLITPKEAESFFRRENEPMLAQVATFAASRYESMVMPTDSEISDYYAKRQAQYSVPEKIEVNYVFFPATDFAHAAEEALMKDMGTNLDQKIDEIYTQQDPNAFRDETGTNMLSATAAKAKIKKELMERAELMEAHKSAIAFANNLLDGHDDQHPFTAQDIFTVAKTNNLTVHTTEPFDEQTGPKEIKLAEKELHYVFSMTADDSEDKDRSRLYVSSPLVTEDGVYIVGLKDKIASHITPLEQIRSEVTEDYRYSKALELARDAGKKFEDASKEASAKGQTFEQLCAAQGVKVLNVPAFSMMTTSSAEITNRTEFQHVQTVAYNIPTGKISPFVPTQEGGIVVYVKQRLPVDESKMQEQLPIYLERLREERQVAAFDQWLEREYHMHANMPADRTQESAG